MLGLELVVVVEEGRPLSPDALHASGPGDQRSLSMAVRDHDDGVHFKWVCLVMESGLSRSISERSG